MVAGEISATVHPFLQGGGEMGALTRDFDWTTTPLGTPYGWPQSLRTTVSNLLRSKFPMFLWWGKDMIQFYNDAYRPSLGTGGKHPSALGAKGRDTWPETWHIISPLLHQVQTTGEAVWMEDQLVPIYRNGTLEDVYWTYSYSSVLDDEGQHAGILVTCTETTQKVANLKRLEESEDRLRFAIEATELGTWDYNPSTNHFTGNARLKEWFGLPPEEALRLEHALTVIDETDRPTVEAAIAKALDCRSGGAYDVAYTIANLHTGQKRNVRARGKAWFTKNGEACRFNGTLQDVTNEVTAKKVLEEKERSLELAIAIGELGVFTVDLATETAVCSPQTANWFGLPEQRRPLADFLSKLHPDDLSVLTETIKRNVNGEGEGRHDVTYRLLPSNGRLRYLRSVGQVQFAAGKAASISGILQDVTEQTLSRISLEESEARFRSLIEEAPVAVFVFRGQDMVINIANRMALDMIRRTEAVVGKPLLEAVPELTDSPAYAVFQEVYRTGQAHYGREVLVPLERNGVLEDRYFNFAYTPLHENGQVVGVMDVATEVTDSVLARKKIEDVVAQRTKELAEANHSLLEANNELQRSNHHLEEFAYAASHDLKEPIRKIHFFTTRLQEQLKQQMTEEQTDSFLRIKNATERMRLLIDDLLLYSHASQRPKEKETVNLTERLKRVLEDLELDIAEKSAVIAAPELPVVQGYGRQLQQLFQNLLSNAVKYSKADTPPQITLASSRSTQNGRDYHVISVTDNGIGFEQQYAEKIFQMFTRLHGKNEYSGTGVGLSIVKKIVENHNGLITVESQKDVGSVFTVYLPAD